MMAYNVEEYIGDAIKELQKESEIKWELIVVDDFSTDSTFQVAKNFADNDNRIKIVKNLSKGKVTGTNYGYSLTSGDIIKCIDSDDVLLRDFFSFYDKLEKYDVHCHSAFVTDSKLNIKATYNVNPLLISESYEFVLSNLISIPKWSWSFSREIAEKIFPMPENLPFEDVWISLISKKYSQNMYVIKEPIYLYRQHKNQTFGGIINYSSDRVIFRAKRLLKLIEVLENEPKVIEGFKKDIFDKTRIFNKLMSQERLSVFDVLKSDLTLLAKLKILLIKKFPLLAKYLTILKWKFDGIKKN